ncbi:MAG: hypothetical protein ABH876_00445 [Patescibacteria group bacterium]|nr:hypothetical protein [Patescibacteria group bacterium]MBU1877246.1 hypothetical protein [Patescibacteria group bacterium]
MINKEKIYVVNLQGQKEPFSFHKVYRSARRVGASRILAEQIAQSVAKDVYSGIKTIDIFKIVKRELFKKEPQVGLKFDLKNSLKRLGPSGFPFEKYVGAILKKRGFHVQLNQYIPGHCCSYEIDFIAKKEDVLYIGECKYRNNPGDRIHLDIALANHARFLDIQNGNFFKKLNKKIKIKSIIITNTKLTSQAIKYSKCVGVDCLGWNYPKNHGLENIIDSQKLYPITILPSLKNYMVEIFNEKNIILVEDLLKIDIEKFSKQAKTSINQITALINEANILLEE